MVEEELVLVEYEDVVGLGCCGREVVEVLGYRCFRVSGDRCGEHVAVLGGGSSSRAPGPGSR